MMLDSMLPLPFTKPLHDGTQYAQQTLPYMATDTQQSYEQHSQNLRQFEYFKQQGWTSKGDLNYRINSEGFRGDEFDYDGCLLTLGCSFTMGIGLAEHQVWPYKLGSALGLPVANVAWYGWAADTCLRFSLYWIKILRPRIIVVMLPPSNRFELFLDPSDLSIAKFPGGPTVISPQGGVPGTLQQNRFIQHYFLNDANSQYNLLRNQLAIRYLSESLSIPCLIYSVLDTFAKQPAEVGYARDLMHAGPVGHQMVAQEMMESCRDLLITKPSLSK